MKFLLPLSFLVLTACATTDNLIKPKIVEKPYYDFEVDYKINIQPIEVKYINNMACVDASNFNILLNNIDELTNQIKIQKQFILSFKEYYNTESK